MQTEFAIGEFTQKVVSPLMADLTRTLEVTYGKTGDQNHGSNFIGNGVVLIGIETIGQCRVPSDSEHWISESCWPIWAGKQ
jgi:hypothetical protein